MPSDVAVQVEFWHTTSATERDVHHETHILGVARLSAYRNGYCLAISSKKKGLDYEQTDVFLIHQDRIDWGRVYADIYMSTCFMLGKKTRQYWGCGPKAEDNKFAVGVMTTHFDLGWDRTDKYIDIVYNTTESVNSYSSLYLEIRT